MAEGVGRPSGRGRSVKRHKRFLRRLTGKPWLIGLLSVCVAAILIEVLRPAGVTVLELRSMIEAWSAVAALVAGQALMAELQQTLRLRTLLVFVAVAVLGMLNAVASLLLAVVHVSAAQSVTAGPAFGAVVAATCLAAASVAPSAKTLPVDHRWERMALIAAATVVAAAEATGAVLVHAVDPTSNVLRGVGATGRLWAVLLFTLTIALFAFAAARFAAEEDGAESGISAQLAAACFLLALGPAERLLTPAPSPDVLSVEVVSSLAAFCLIAFGARRSLRLLRTRAHVTAAANVARAHLARDLHDGLCQDLAFIVASVPSLHGAAGEERRVALAAERALATARGVLDEFASPGSSPDVAGALRALADELSSRFSVSIQVRAHAFELSPADAEDVVRIAHEAIINAARHGHAREVVVELSGNPSSFLLKVSDDGSGIVLGSGDRERFGMRAMSERAMRLGGWLEAASRRHGGTELRVVVSR